MNPIRHSDKSLIVRSLSVIAWVYLVALLSALLATELSRSRSGIARLLFLTVLVLPWVSGAIMLTWSDGPAKNWAVKLVVSLSLSAILCYMGIILTQMARFLGLSPVVCSGLFVAFPMAWYLLYLGHMSPKRCPGCGQHSMIPLMRLGRPEARSTNTRWCAACGEKYWKDRSGTWQPERRKTWHDRNANSAEPSADAGHGIAAPLSVRPNEVSQATASVRGLDNLSQNTT